MNVKPHHPLQELLAQLLFSIETVPQTEQRRMVNFACKEAAKWHEDQLNTSEAVCISLYAYRRAHRVPDEGFDPVLEKHDKWLEEKGIKE